MLLIDASNRVFSTVLEYHRSTGEQADIQLIRHLITDGLRVDKKRLAEFADEIVMCFDGRKYWRREFFQHYKAKRAAGREASSFDWDAFFPAYDQFKQELREFFPIKCVEVEGAEADDIMGVLASRYADVKKVCVASSDKDMVQLQQNMNPKIKQYSYFHKKFLTPKTSKYDLFEHVVKGDSGDGVPNILSPDDVLITPGSRQRPISSKKLEEWRAKGGLFEPENFCTDTQMLERFQRNRTLIDLRKIPGDLAQKIDDAYTEYEVPKGKMFGYLTTNKMMKILREGGF